MGNKNSGRKIEKEFLSDDEKKLALSMANEGKPSRDIQEALGLTAGVFFDIRQRDLVFARNYALARQEGLEQLADDLITIPDTYADVLRGRLKSENVRWLLSKRKAETYGDRVELNVNHQVDIGTALNEARRRALPGRDLTIESNTQVTGMLKQIPSSTTGSKPVDDPEDRTNPEDGTEDDIFS